MSSEFGVAGLSDAEFDQLADYTFGALDVVDADRVAALIRDEPRWSQAHAALLAAGDSVAGDLAALGDLVALGDAGAGVVPMPDDVAARIDAALAAASAGAHGPVTGVDRRAPRARSSGPDRVAGDRPRSTGPGRGRAGGGPGRSRKMAMVLAGVAAAAVVAIGIPVILPIIGNNFAKSTTASGDAAAPLSESGAGATGGPLLLQTGTNYQPATLSQLARERAAERPPAATIPPSAPAVVSGTTGQQYDQSKGASAPDALSSVADPTGLKECLAAIAQAHPGTPAVVDYAYFQGRPAVIVLLLQSEHQVVVVVGPTCGSAGADELYTAVVQ